MFIAIVPAYNEAKQIGSVVRSLFEHVDRVVVVDDASADQTANIAAGLGAVVLRHRFNRGQGAALETGHAYARQNNADYLVHFDADGQFEAGDIGPALNKLKKSGADILFGSRFLDRRSKIPWLKRYLILPAGRLVNRIFTGIKLSDAHNGFRILNRKALQKVKISQDGMAHASEILAQVKKNKLKYIEFPVKVTYSEFGQGVSGGLKTIRDLLFGKFIR